MSNKGIILLSGGLDSATTAAMAVRDGYTLHAMTFSYGQKHSLELEFAAKVAKFFSVEDHVIVDIDPGIFSSSLVKNSSQEVPKERDLDREEDIPSTYVPARNILFLSYALAYGESHGIYDIFIGANAVDYSGYPDCRPEFFRAFGAMAREGTRAGVTGRDISIHTPLIDLKKYEIIRIGIELGFDYSLTHSCYDPHDDGSSCGSCDSCQIRKKGFREAGVADPTRYRS